MPCRTCSKVDVEAIEQTVDAYIKRINKEIACDESLYRDRLNICNDCDSNREGMCSVCGCFIKVRAYKKHMTCPSVMGNKWLLQLGT